MTIVEAMPGAMAQSPQEAAAQAREGAAQQREVAAQVREQVRQAREVQRDVARDVSADVAASREELRSAVRTTVQTEIRNVLRGELREDQVGAIAAQVAERAANEAARQAELVNGRTIRISRPGQPEAVVRMPDPNSLIPQKAVDMTYAFFATIVLCAIGIPLARAFGRWIDRRGTTASAAPAREINGQLHQLQQSVEAIAIEVERISEAQRYAAKVLGAGAAQPVELRDAERVAVR